MSIQQSNITGLNYDLVLGTSQKSINGIMKTYYSNAAEYFWPQTWYFVHSLPLNQQEAWQAMGNQDPFEIPSWNGQGAMPANIQACVNGGFTCAFQFILGDPGNPAVGNTPATYPSWDYNYLTYLPTETFWGQTYNYTMCCQNLQVVCWDPFTNIWTNYTQPTAPNSPMSSIIKFAAYATLTSQSKAYSASDNTIPQDVKTQAAIFQANNMPFSVQQFTLNLDAMAPSTMGVNLPFMTTIDEFYYTLAPCFITAYAGAMKSSFKSVPTFCYALPLSTQPGIAFVNPTNVKVLIENFVDTNGNVVSNPTPDQASLSTVNYFCAINGDTPVTPQQFKWNWLDSDNDESNYDGAMAISKYALAKIIDSQMRSYVEENCWQPQVSCTQVNGADQWYFGMVNGTLTGNPLVTDNSNTNLLEYSYKSSASASGITNSNDSVEITINYNVTVYISSSTSITVKQTVQTSYYANGTGGMPIDNTYTDVYSIIVQPNGTLDFDLVSSNDPSFEPPSNIPDLTSDEIVQFDEALQKSVYEFGPTDLSPQPLGTIQQVVFPGGNTFMFKNAQFVPSNDLVFEVTYLKTIL